MEKQLAILARQCGVTAAAGVEIAHYLRRPYQQTAAASQLREVPADEPQLQVWRQYAAAAEQDGAYAVLRHKLVQLQFPVQAGLSETAAYRAVTRQGQAADGLSEASGLPLRYPEKLRLVIYESLAGAVPVLIAYGREDFVLLLQALCMRNEPQPVSDSQGAAMVIGYNNWDRIERLKQAWQAENPGDILGWTAEFRRIAADKRNYQDKFIIISDGYYSAVPPAALALPAAEWRQKSIALRLEHECTHYVTYRLLAPDGKSLLDELIADYMAVTAVNGAFRADWLLRFLGLADFPRYDRQGRLAVYCQEEQLSPAAFYLLQYSLVQAASNLQRFSAHCRLTDRTGRLAELLTIAGMTLTQLAQPDVLPVMQAAYQQLLQDSAP